MDISRITVVGSGNMGSGIAQAFAQAGFDVTMNDLDQSRIEASIDRLKAGLQKRVDAGKMQQAACDAIFSRMTPESDLAKATANADLVVEAVFEDLNVKRELFAKLDAVCPPNTILATNTSSFYVKDIAAATKRPNMCLGLHFFFPAHINKLVEVVRGPDTDDVAFDATFQAVHKSGKIPIETADAPGFAVNRFFVPWINESCRLLDDYNVATIEAAAKKAFNIGMGPFLLMNVTGVPISLHAQTTLHNELGPFYKPSEHLVKQVTAKENWILEGDVDESAYDAIARRLRGVAFGIACHLVDEQVATIKETDRGATIGLAWAKGPFAMMNQLGLDAARSEVAAISEMYEGFAMPQCLEGATSFHIPAVVLETEGFVSTITFDRPEALNALDENVLRDLDACLDALPDETRCLIVTGSGKAFIAGADIPTMHAMNAAGAQAYTELGNRVITRLANLPCPVIMAVNGFAFGGGLELALAGDLLYASDKSLLGLPEVGLGIHPGFGGTQRLPRRIGIGAAKELLFTGRNVKPDEAKEVGLVNEVIPAADLMMHCHKIAATIASKAPLAIAGAKTSVDQGVAMDLANGLRVEQESVVLLFDTEDKRAGLEAFMQGTKAKFSGN